MNALHRFAVLYALMYAAFGVSSPFMPAFFEGRGLAPEQLGVVFAAGTAIRLVSGPLCARLADHTQALEVPPLREFIRTPFCDVAHPQLIVRLGVAVEKEPVSVRRRADEVIRPEP